MYGPKDSFTVHVPITGTQYSQIKSNTHRWINKKRVFGSVQLEYERENEIMVKSPVRFFSLGILATWYYSPRLIYYYTFIFNEDTITVHAEVQTPTDHPTTNFMRLRLKSSYNILRCKDFLRTNFDYIGVDSNVSRNALYPSVEVDKIKSDRNRMMLIFPFNCSVFFMRENRKCTECRRRYCSGHTPAVTQFCLAFSQEKAESIFKYCNGFNLRFP